jgi:hypothetical protein
MSSCLPTEFFDYFFICFICLIFGTSVATCGVLAWIKSAFCHLCFCIIAVDFAACDKWLRFEVVM